jgi:pimeloyl-ACP methyl ester carboxylesterase
VTAIYRTEAGGEEVRRRYARTLRAWPVPCEHRRVPTREGETFVIVSGPEDAPPLLLFHGSGTNSAIWTGDVVAWSEHFRVHAVDLIGEPGLSAPSRPPLGSDAYALWLDDVLRELGPDTVSVVGASLGGWLATDYATRRPGRVRSLVLLCPGGIGRQKWGWVVPALLLRPLGLRGLRRIMRTITGLDLPRAATFLEDMALTHREFLPRKDRLPIFPDAALRGLTMPVLAIVGDRDVMLDSRDTARRLAATVPHADVRVLPDTGHAIIDQTATILTHLARPS